MRGLTYIVRAKVDRVQGLRFPTLIEDVLLGNGLGDFLGFLEHWDRSEDMIIQKTSSRGSSLMHRSSGYMCGFTVLQLHEAWSNLHAAMVGDDEHQIIVKRSAMDQWYRCIQEGLVTVNCMKTWLSSSERCQGHPQTAAMLKGDLFWILQRLLFDLHSYKLLQTKSWVFAKGLYVSGALPWQIGWFESNPLTVRLMSSILFAD